MLTKTHIKDKISSNAMLIRQHGISKIGLFGSFATQKQKKGSDIDILIDFQQDKETFDNFMAICDLLDTIFKGYKVEVVTTGGLSPYIGPHILNSVEYVQIAN
ncbi:MAG: nucleotidyltransferase domain-containing protein [Saprospiraceae bacterium]|nr:nucleotidyltransferase domain-containing protein [Saprospiraceae bacterium]